MKLSSFFGFFTVGLTVMALTSLGVQAVPTPDIQPEAVSKLSKFKVYGFTAI